MQQQFPDNNGVVKDEISLKEVILSIQEWWKFIITKWKLVIVCGIIGGVLGLIYSILAPTKYVAVTTFVLQDAKSGGNSYANIAAKFGLNIGSGGGGDGLFGNEDNIITFLKSRTMGAQTLLSSVNINGKEQLLIEKYMQFNNMHNTFPKKQFHFNPDKSSLTQDSIITFVHKKILDKNLTVEKPDKEGNIISVITTSKDQDFSKLYTDKLIENTANFYFKLMTRKAQENVNVLQHQVDSVRNILNNAIIGVAINSDAIPNINVAYQRLKVPIQKNVIDLELNKAILSELVTNLELAKISLRDEMPLFQIIDKPVLPLDKRRIGKVKGIVGGGFFLGIVTLIVVSLRFFFKKIVQY